MKTLTALITILLIGCVSEKSYAHSSLPDNIQICTEEGCIKGKVKITDTDTGDCKVYGPLDSNELVSCEEFGKE